MWFKIQLSSYLPPISVLVGVDGMLYLKLVDIGALLGKKNAYSYKQYKLFHAVEAREVLPATGFFIGTKTLALPVVPITVACRLIENEDLNLAKLVCYQFGQGYAHKKGMRSFVTNERKAPLLECVDTVDERCVHIPQWIRDFVKDLTLYREEIANSELPSTSSHVRQPVKRKWVDSCQELFKRLHVVHDDDDSCTAQSEPPMANIKTERPDTPATEPSTLNVESPESPVPEESMQATIPEIPLEPPLEPIPEIQTEPVPEHVTEHIAETSNTGRKILSACLNIAELNFSPTTSVFPQPGDLIIKFRTPPPRVIFVQGEEDDMYWMCRNRS